MASPAQATPEGRSDAVKSQNDILGIAAEGGTQELLASENVGSWAEDRLHWNGRGGESPAASGAGVERASQYAGARGTGVETQMSQLSQSLPCGTMKSENVEENVEA